jgi:hypothetical protein
MKKSFLSLGILSALAFSANAQEAASSSEFKPTKGNITIEFNANSPFNGGAGDRGIFSLNNNALRARYFLSDGLAIRCQFSVNAHRYKQDLGTTFDQSNNTPNGNITSSSTSTTTVDYKMTSSNTLVIIAPGLEIHKNVAERLSVYYGGYINLAFQSAKGKIEGTPGSVNTSQTSAAGTNSSNSSAAAGSYKYEVKGSDLGNVSSLGLTDPTTSGVTGQAPWTSAPGGGPIFATNGPNTYTSQQLANNGTRGYFSFGLVGVLGADYYITKAFYLGVECGLGLASTSYKKVKTTENTTDINVKTVLNGNTTPATPDPVTSGTYTNTSTKDTQFTFSPVVNASFRLGFWF